MSTQLLLCTDLDRTLIPNGPQPESPRARPYFRALCADQNVKLAYVSGRHRSLVQQAIVNYALPEPDYVVGDVGTTVYRVERDGQWSPVAEWEQQIGLDWAARSRAEICSRLADLSDLRLQEHSKQNRYKLSYYVPLHANRSALDKVIRARLKSANVQASLVWSVDEPEGIGLLDVLPAGATKFHAIEFLMQTLGYAFADTLFSGDSGNDLEVLVSPVPAVLVANARAEVRAEALRLALERDTREALYLAKGGFLKLNGNYSAGILEGLAHYHPELVEEMISRFKSTV